MATEYLTEPEIIRMLNVRRKGFKTVRLLMADIERVTGMAISLSHLFNIVSGRRPPNEAVLKYLGGSTANVYQVERSMAKRKAKR